MSTTLIDLARQYLTPDVIDKLASFTGETPAAAGKAMAGATPAVLAGMLNTAQGPGGLSQLVNLFQQGKFDGSMLGNLAGAFSGNSMDGLIKLGGPLLNSLFGARSGGLTDLLASFAGVKRSSATSLLSVAAPFVMSLVGKQLASRGGVNANNLKDLLSSQRQAVAAAAPPGLAQTLGLSDLSLPSSHSAEYVRDPVPPVREAGSPLSKWLPWLIGIAAVLLLFSWMRGCGRPPVTGVSSDTTPAMTAPAPTVDTTRSVPSDTSTGPGQVPSADSAGAAAPATPEGAGAMGGQGKPGKLAPAAPAPTPQPQQKP